MKVLDTERLVLRHIEPGDDGFILELLNEPGWLHHIGDRGIRTREAAREYIRNGPAAMVERLGFGLYLVERKADAASLGICGLVRRDGLDDVDIGFAFLARHGGCGYAFESACAVMAYAKEVLGLGRIVAITTTDNHPSIRLLERIGLRLERMVTLPGDDEAVQLFANQGPF